MTPGVSATRSRTLRLESRQVVHFLRGKNAANRRCGCREIRIGLDHDIHRLRAAGHLQVEVQADLLALAELHVFVGLSLKTRGGGRNGVSAGLQAGELVDPGVVRGNGRGNAGCSVAGSYADLGDDRAAGVGDGATNDAVDLGSGNCRKKKKGEENNSEQRHSPPKERKKAGVPKPDVCHVSP